MIRCELIAVLDDAEKRSQMQTVDYYRVLQVRRGAGREDITAAYRRLCKLYHPDVNASPGAEELMKQINMAYSALLKKPVIPNAVSNGEVDLQSAASCAQSYFSALLNSDFLKAYTYVSYHDKKYVTYQGFCDWRKSVQRLFIMREFSVKVAGGTFAYAVNDSQELTAVTLTISISEKNTVTQSVEHYSIRKLAVLEPVGWRIFLGYRDFSEIAKVFENLSARQERGEMAKHWDEYCSVKCRDLNMLNLRGLLNSASPELYRYKRYKQQMTVACFRVKPASTTRRFDPSPEYIEIAAKTLVDSLRETDIAAYLGNGIFAVLFVELKKRHAAMITQRIVSKLKIDIHKNLRMSISAECRHTTYDGGVLADYVTKCSLFT